jgi:hypothetical protein
MIFKKDKKKIMRYKDLTDLEKKHLINGLVVDGIIFSCIIAVVVFLFYIFVVV